MTMPGFGRYTVKRELGRGAMGVVYEGWDPQVQRRVAIKTIPLPDPADQAALVALEWFKTESQATGRLSHRNIVSIYDAGETADQAYLVLEYVEGRTLRQVIDDGRRFPLAEIAGMMRQLLSGLQASHDKGVIHRDIKPSNIMVAGDGTLKISDFGVARLDIGLGSQTGMVIGTPAYMSPEQLDGDAGVDSRADVYSAGIVMYELLAGCRPFEGQTFEQISQAIFHKTPVSPSRITDGVPPDIDAVVGRALAKRPAARYQTAAAFSAAIEAAMESQWRDAATMVAPARKPGKAALRSGVPLQAGLAGGLVAVAMALGWWLFSDPRPATRTSSSIPMPAVTGSTEPTAPVPPAPRQVASPAEPSPVRQPVPATPAMPPPADHAMTEIPAIAPLAAPVLVPPTLPPPVLSSPVLSSPVLSSPVLSSPVLSSPTLAPAGRAELLSRLGPLPCSAVAGIGQPSVVAGIGQPSVVATEENAGEVARLLADLGGWTAVSFSGPYCPLVGLVHRLQAPPAVTGTFDLGLDGGRTALRGGDVLKIVVNLPAFTSHLILDYVSTDGEIFHLYPSRFNDDQPYPARGVISFSNPKWITDEPYGRDVIVGIASSVALFAKPRPKETETMAGYVPDLATMIGNATKRGGRIEADLLVIDTIAP